MVGLRRGVPAISGSQKAGKTMLTAYVDREIVPTGPRINALRAIDLYEAVSYASWG